MRPGTLSNSACEAAPRQDLQRCQRAAAWLSQQHAADARGCPTSSTPAATSRCRKPDKSFMVRSSRVRLDSSPRAEGKGQARYCGARGVLWLGCGRGVGGGWGGGLQGLQEAIVTRVPEVGRAQGFFCSTAFREVCRQRCVPSTRPYTVLVPPSYPHLVHQRQVHQPSIDVTQVPPHIAQVGCAFVGAAAARLIPSCAVSRAHQAVAEGGAGARPRAAAGVEHLPCVAWARQRVGAPV